MLDGYHRICHDCSEASFRPSLRIPRRNLGA
jgi:hypothetical protein